MGEERSSADAGAASEVSGHRRRGLAGWRRDERWVLAACVAMAGLEVSVLYAFATLAARSFGL